MDQQNANRLQTSINTNQGTQLDIKNLTNFFGNFPNSYPLYKIFLFETYEKQEVIIKILNILNQKLQQGIYFCESNDSDKQDFTIENCDLKNIYNQKDDVDIQDYDIQEPIIQNKKYFAKIKNQKNNNLISKIDEQILQPIRVHINKFIQENVDQYDIYDETMDLIKILNGIKIS